MKFTKIRFWGLTQVDFPIVGATPQDVFICKGVDGLGPPEIELSMADTINAGGFYQGRRPLNRQLVALIGLNPNYQAGQLPSDLRTTLYGLVRSGPGVDHILVYLMNGEDIVAKTLGYVSKFEINPFSENPEVQVTVDCDQPYLEAPNDLYVTTTSSIVQSFVNQGTAPSGFRMSVTFTSPDSRFYLRTGFDPREMRVEYPFIVGDKLTIDTRPSQRGVWLTRNGQVTNIIYALTPDSEWLLVHPGTNSFSLPFPVKTTWNELFYRPKYWGI